MVHSNHPSNQPSLLQILLYTLLLALFVLLGYVSFSKIGSSKLVLDSTQVYVTPDSNFTHLWTAPSDWRMMYLKPEEKA